MYSGYFGLILCSYLLYLFLTRMELFLIISFMLESFSIIFIDAIATIANSRGIYCAIETIANDITEYTATNINLGDPIAVLGSIDSVLGSVDLYINSFLFLLLYCRAIFFTSVLLIISD